MRIKLYDEDTIYAFVMIRDDGIEDFCETLAKYKDENDEYNIDDFLKLIEKKDYYIDYFIEAEENIWF